MHFTKCSLVPTTIAQLYHELVLQIWHWAWRIAGCAEVSQSQNVLNEVAQSQCLQSAFVM